MKNGDEMFGRVMFASKKNRDSIINVPSITPSSLTECCSGPVDFPCEA